MDPRIAWLMPEQIGPAAKIYERMHAACAEMINAQKGENTNGPNGGVIYNKIAQKPQSTPEQLRAEMEQQMEDKKRLLAQEGINEPSPIALSRDAGTRAENPAATTDSSYEAISCAGAARHPWVKRHHYAGRHKREGITRLHDEIIDFHRWVIATPEEYQMRYDVVLRVESIIKKQFPRARVEVFGSFQTGLYLPTSDIDMVVFNQQDAVRTGALYQLQDTLIHQNIAEKLSIKVIDRAAVPIVKMRDLLTDIKVDISFNMESGVTSVSLIKEFIREFPALPYLVLLLKQFLLQRDMNEVWTGGISSYGLILMTVSFLQQHKRIHPVIEGTQQNVNLGVLLIEFFELYGRKFNYEKLCIRVKDGGAYIKKEEMAAAMKMETGGVPKYYPNYLSIEDPLTPSNDIGRASHGAESVARAFEYAYRVLSRAVSPQAESYPMDCTQSILGRIIMITDEVFDYRQWVYTYWSCRVPRLAPITIEVVPAQKKSDRSSVNGGSSPERMTDDEVEENIGPDDQHVTSQETAPSPPYEAEKELAGFSSNDNGEGPDETDDSDDSDCSDPVAMRSTGGYWQERPKRFPEKLSISIANQRAAGFQRTIHQEVNHRQSHHRRSGSRDQPQTRHYKREDHEENSSRQHKSSQSDSNSTQDYEPTPRELNPPTQQAPPPPQQPSQVKSPLASSGSAPSGTSPTKRVNLSSRSFMNALHSATKEPGRNRIHNRQQQAQLSDKDSTTAADQNRRRNRKDKHEYEDDRRSQRSRRSSDSRSSPIPIPEDTMIDNRRNQRSNQGRYSDRSFDNASPGMMSGNGRSHGSNFRRHDRSSGGGDGHISPQGNYNQSRNGNAAMDAPSSYRVSDYDYGEQRSGHYDKRRQGMRKSDERRSNYKSNRDNQRYYENDSRLDMGRQQQQQRHSGEMGRPGQMGRNGSGMRSNQRGSRDSFSPGPRDQI